MLDKYAYLLLLYDLHLMRPDHHKGIMDPETIFTKQKKLKYFYSTNFIWEKTKT